MGREFIPLKRGEEKKQKVTVNLLDLYSSTSSTGFKVMNKKIIIFLFASASSFPGWYTYSIRKNKNSI